MMSCVAVRRTLVTQSNHRQGAAPWGTILFLTIFVLLLLVAASYYLYPAYRAMASASQPADRKLLQGVSMLVLAVVLFCLLGGLVLAFRIGRFFLPRPPRKKIQTEVVDIWKESGKRLVISDEDEEQIE